MKADLNELPVEFDETIDMEAKEQLNKYYIERFIVSITKEKSEKKALLSELDAITEGKSIVLSNAK